MNTFQIKTAQANSFPLRTVLYGALGSGCTTTMMKFAKAWGRVVVVDWHNEVEIQFPGVEFITPQTNTIEEATEIVRWLSNHAQRPDGIILNGFSRVWSGPQGALDYVGTMARKNRRDSGEGWRMWDAAYEEFRTVYRAFPGPIGATLTAKERKESAVTDGRPQVFSIGLEPEMKTSFLLENHVAGLMMERTLYFGRTLHSDFGGKVVLLPSEELGRELYAWSGWQPVTAPLAMLPDPVPPAVVGESAAPAVSLMPPAATPTPAQEAVVAPSGAWLEVRVHGGAHKGKALRELSEEVLNELDSTFRPKPTATAEALALRAALDERNAARNLAKAA